MRQSRVEKILVVDDHDIVREGIKVLLKEAGRYHVLEASSSDEAYDIYSREKPDLLVTDLALPDVSGLELINRISRRQPDALVIVVSMYSDAVFARRAVRHGALGYVAKEVAARELLPAIRDVQNGNLYIDSVTALGLARASLKNEHDLTEILSPREFEIFCSMAQGKNTRMIGEYLNLSPNTIGNYRRSIMSKLNIQSMAELVHIAIERGIVSCTELSRTD